MKSYLSKKQEKEICADATRCKESVELNQVDCDKVLFIDSVLNES